MDNIRNMLQKIVLSVFALLLSVSISFATGGKEEKESKKTEKNTSYTQADLQLMAMLQIEELSFDEIPIRVERTTAEQKLLNMLQIEDMDLSKPVLTEVERWLMNSLKIEAINLAKVSSEIYTPLVSNKESSWFDFDIEIE